MNKDFIRTSTAEQPPGELVRFSLGNPYLLAKRKESPNERWSPEQDSFPATSASRQRDF